MEGERDVLERITIHYMFVVVVKRVEQGLFVTDQRVLRNVVTNQAGGELGED